MSIDNATFVVQRGDTQSSCLGSDLQSKLQDDDLLIAQKDDDYVKVSGSDFKQDNPDPADAPLCSCIATGLQDEKGVELLFDGDTSEHRGCQGNDFTLSWPSGVITGSKIEILIHRTGTLGTSQIEINDRGTQSVQAGWWDITYSFGETELTYIRSIASPNLYNSSIDAIRVDGTVIVCDPAGCSKISDHLFIVTDGDNGHKSVTGAQVKELFGPVMPWEGHDGGIFHITNVQASTLKLTGGPFQAWNVDGTNEREIEEVAISEELVFVTGPNCSKLFYNSSNGNSSTVWEFGQFTNVSKVVNMEDLFKKCTKFNADISGWDTSNVENMSGMFSGSFNALFNQDIGGWDTSNVLDMSSMLSDASNFDQDISGWDTSNVENMRAMFSGCRKFNQNIGGWNTSNVAGSMSYMFSNCYVFDQDLSGWNTSKVTDMKSMFAEARAFNGDISGWSTSNVENMSSMFSGASTFNQNIGGWDTSKVTDMDSMFRIARAFDQDIGGWNTSNVTKAGTMFYMAAVFNQNINGWDMSNVAGSMSYMFYNCENFNHDLGNWNVSKVTNMKSMFNGANSFDKDIGNWNVSKVTDMEQMFDGASSFDQDLSKWCVKEIGSKPFGFDSGAGFFYKASKQPQWGTCP